MAQWNFDPAHSNAEFSVRHMMVTNVRGTFDKVSGTLDFDPANPAAARVEATIEAASISTGAEDRDNHLRSADFFDVEKFPTITFKSTSVEPTGDESARITGELTMRGVTRTITIDAEYLGQGPSPFGDVRAGFEGTVKINREDFGLTWNQALESGGVLVGKEVKITLNVQAVMASEAEMA